MSGTETKHNEESNKDLKNLLDRDQQATLDDLLSYNAQKIERKGNEECPYYRSLIEPTPSPLNGVDTKVGLNHQIVQPTIIASRLGSGATAKLYVVIVGFLNYEVKNSNFEFYFNYGLSNSGETQLNIYVKFNSEKRLPHNEFEYYAFEIGINRNSYKEKSIRLKGIKTVRVFLYEDDPETSRGTTTTVQSSTGGD